MSTRTGGLLMNKVLMQDRVQVPQRSQKRDLSECCDLSLCICVGVGA